jgi:exonuclease VII large subunit
VARTVAPVPAHSPYDPPGDEIVVVDAAVLAERRARRAEIGEDALRARAAQAERAAVSMERRLSDAESHLGEAAQERDRLAEQLAETERALTVARQQSFADEQARIDAEDELAAARRAGGDEIQGVQHELDAARERVATLERELAGLRTQLTEQEAVAQAEIVLLQHELDRRLLVEEALRSRFSAEVVDVAQTADRLREAARAPVTTPSFAPVAAPDAPAATPVTLISDLDRAAERLRAQVLPEAPADAAEPRRGALRRLAGRLRKPRR